MIIMIPVQENNESSSIAVAFGRAPFFAIYDTEKKSIDFEENKNVDRAGGVGISSGQFAIDNSVQKVVVVNVGPKAVSVLESGRVKITKVEAGSILSDLIKEFE